MKTNNINIMKHPLCSYWINTDENNSGQFTVSRTDKHWASLKDYIGINMTCLHLIIPLIGLLGLLATLTSSCKKDSTNIDPVVVKVPVLTSDTVTGITQTAVITGGIISSDGGDTITARGVCWSLNAYPTISDNKTIDGKGSGSFTSNLTGLTKNTTYFVRAYATNSAGTGYGNELSFSTLSEITVTDIDGNVYQTVTIGTQVWMVEDLKTTKYRDGTAIPNVTDSAAWLNTTAGAYCNYRNELSYANTYGHIYNWYAASDSRNIAPAGWHVPTKAEFEVLINYLGGSAVAGGKMKETGTAHWVTNIGATNSSGFTAIPGGGFAAVSPYGFFPYGVNCNWWTKTVSADGEAYLLILFGGNTTTDISFDAPLTAGFAIRCVKD